MVTIYLLRHGETAYNADGNRYCGRTDIDLTEKGRLQAEAMNKSLKHVPFDAIFSSPLKRAKRTAEIVSGRADDVKTDNRLMEVDFGNWEGKPSFEFIKEDPDSWKDWLADPASFRAGRIGESGSEVLKRLNDFYEELVKKYDGKTVLIIGHNGINRLFLAHRLGMPLKNYRNIVQENSALTQITIDSNHRFQLLKLNT